MPYAGADNFTHDHLAGGTKGGMWRAKRTQRVPVAPNEWGYNQARPRSHARCGRVAHRMTGARYLAGGQEC